MGTSLNKDIFIKALKFCFTGSYCSFQGKFYSQIEGLPMGSPLSAIVSEFVLDILFYNVKNNFPDLKFLCKYVDHSYFISDPSALDHFSVFLNNSHNRLKFIREFEINKTLNLLDISIHRVNNILKFNHFCKFHVHR